MVMSGLGGRLRLHILFPGITPFPITYHYVSSITSFCQGRWSQVLFAMALQVPGEALVLSSIKYNCGTFHAMITSKVLGDIHHTTLENSVAPR